jgi:hypothetical protein
MEDRAGRAGEVQKLTKNSNIQSYFKLVKMEEPALLALPARDRRNSFQKSFLG